MKTQGTIRLSAIIVASFATQLAWPDICRNAEVAFAHSNPPQPHKDWMTYVVAPRKTIGTDMGHWFPYLLENYELHNLVGTKSRHWKQPTVSLELRDELTSIQFHVNLATNRHMLHKVETSSEELLDAVGIPWQALNALGAKVWCVCGDATCDSFSIGKTDLGAFKATWTIGWD